MPRIPQYRSQRSLTRQAPSAPVSISAMTTEARAISQFGVTLANIANNIIEAKADQEYAQAKIKGVKALKELENESLEDIDFQTVEPRYSQRIEQIKQDISKDIRYPQAKRIFEQDFDLKSTYSFYNIMANVRKRFFAYDEELMSQEIADTKERYYSASSENEKQSALDEIAHIFNRRVENQLLNSKEAALLYKQTIKDLQIGQIKWDIAQNPSFVREQLESKDGGVYRDIYKNISSEDRVDLLKTAKAAERNFEKEQKRLEQEQLVANRFKYIAQIADGTLNWQNSGDIIREVAMTDPELAEAMLENIDEGEPVLEHENDKTFMDLAEGIFTSMNAKAISDFLIKALTETKNISKDRLTSLVYAARQRQEELNRGEKKSFWQTAFDIIKLMAFGNPDVLINVIKRAQKENTQGEDILNFANDEIRQHILKYRPEIKTFPEDGQLMKDAYGNNIIVKPDGSYKREIPIDYSQLPGNIPSFDTVEEVEKADLPKGTLITINGRRAVVK